VNAKDDGVTPLHFAAGGGHKEVIELLIAKGADVNAKRVIAKGADVNAKNADGETPLDWAIKQEYPETADLLRKHGGKTKKELEAAGK